MVRFFCLLTLNLSSLSASELPSVERLWSCLFPAVLSVGLSNRAANAFAAAVIGPLSLSSSSS